MAENETLCEKPEIKPITQETFDKVVNQINQIIEENQFNVIFFASHDSIDTLVTHLVGSKANLAAMLLTVLEQDKDFSEVLRMAYKAYRLKKIFGE